jgi:hypothetical protein
VLVGGALQSRFGVIARVQDAVGSGGRDIGQIHHDRRGSGAVANVRT